MSATVDTQSVQGTLISIMLLILAKFFEAINVIMILQGLAYFFTILVAVDTMLGNSIRKWIVSKIKGHAGKSKGSGSNQAL